MRKLIYVIIFTMFLAACSTVDCPLNSYVGTYYKLKGSVSKLPLPLTIITPRNEFGDTVLLNQLNNADSFALPMSYSAPSDMLYFSFQKGEGQTLADTIEIFKSDVPHFESVDCSPAIFHKITGINTTHNAIDSIVINNPNVNYDYSKAHFYIYFKNSALQLD